MAETDNKDAFDKLIAGLSASERQEMLNRINQSAPQAIQFVDTERYGSDDWPTLQQRLNGESVFYKIYLWFRSFFTKKATNALYNEDLLTRLARKINRDHPGLIDHHAELLDSVFYERLKTLKDAADFFKPYFTFVDSAPGDFYVFLSSFVSPELSDTINRNADPYILPFTKNPTPDVKNELLHKLDELLNSMDSGSRQNLYFAISGLNWLEQYTRMPFIHFCSQFTNIAGSNFTCPYNNAKSDFEPFGALFSHVVPVQSEALEALFLFSQKKELSSNAQGKDVERAVKEFMAVASSHIATIQMFMSGVPMLKIGKLVNEDYDWEPGNIDGAEAWFPSFRNHWRKIVEVRWNDWLRDRKKSLLSSNLKSDFMLNEFPVMHQRPWMNLWARVPFAYELTGGFLSWFAVEKYDSIITPLNEVMLEGIFIKNENRQSYSEGLNFFVQANKQMLELLNNLAPGGPYGTLFDEFASSKIRTLQVQNQINSMMKSTEAEIADILKKFQKGAAELDDVFKGFFDDTKDGVHDGLQNWTSMKGHQNREWRDNLRKIRDLIKKAIFYLSELEPIDQATKDGR